MSSWISMCCIIHVQACESPGGGEEKEQNRGYQTAGQLIVEPSGSKQELRRSTGIKHEIKKRLGMDDQLVVYRLMRP